MIEYDFQCPVCHVEVTVSKKDFDVWGAPFCEGRPCERHERTTMKRYYTPPTVVWPKADRGH